MNTFIVESGHAARFFPSGGMVDVMGADMTLRESRHVLLAVWRSDGTTVCYVADPVDGS